MKRNYPQETCCPLCHLQFKCPHACHKALPLTKSCQENCYELCWANHPWVFSPLKRVVANKVVGEAAKQ